RIQDPEYLPLIGCCISSNIFRRERRSGRVAPRRVADQPGEVPDQEHDLVTKVLKAAHLVDEHRMPQMQVRCSRIKAGLYDQPPPRLKPGLEFTFKQDIDSAAPDFCKLLFCFTHIGKSGGARGRKDKRFRDGGHGSAATVTYRLKRCLR